MTSQKQIDEAIMNSDIIHYRLKASLMAASAPNLIIDTMIGSPSPMIYFKLDGVFYMVGRSFAKMLGYDPIELEDEAIISFIHPEDVKATAEAMSYASKGVKPRGFCNRYQHKKGHYVWTYWHPQAEAQDKIYGVAYCTEIKNPHEGIKAGFVPSEIEEKYKLS